MKANKLTCLLAIGLALTLATGCRKSPTKVTDIKGGKMGTPGGDGPTRPFDAGQLTGGIGGTPLPDLGDLEKNFHFDRSTLAPHTVHFDFDSATVKSSEQSHVEAVASHMKGSANPLLIEGHCDERGTEEYNRSLGERRAMALREALLGMGVDPSKMTTRSFGEDKPVATGQDESAYRQNRRGEFIVLLPK